MIPPVKASFEPDIVQLPMAAILPLKTIPETVKDSVKFRRIAQSIREIGIIEPIVVSRSKDDPDIYLLLDGHVRYTIMRDDNQPTITCLISDDDEAFTYNKRVNRLATIQEHFMIMRALDRGVSEEKLARALNVEVKHLKRRKTLLDGICPEVVDLLKDKSVNPGTFEVLRKMKPYRQIEAADLMASAGNFSSSYAKALLAGTKQDDLARPDVQKKVHGLTPEQMSRMEREMETVTGDFKAIEASYGEDVLHLVVASGYLNRLISNPAIEDYLERRHPELLIEFRAVVAATSLDQGSLPN
ncbi:MAG: ParB N-terminal domain-containing protein [Caulobacterales bacterium]|nr:ParB N-terminal domain-containing protein [Caulobacterales bacterium]